MAKINPEGYFILKRNIYICDVSSYCKNNNENILKEIKKCRKEIQKLNNKIEKAIFKTNLHIKSLLK